MNRLSSAADNTSSRLSRHSPLGAAIRPLVISRASRGTPRIAAFLLAVVFTTGAITALFHMGGENQWWTLPAACAGGGDVDLEKLAAIAFGTGPAPRAVLCDAVTWRFLGLSMAGWNVLISTALAVFSLFAAKRPKDARAPRP